LLDEARELGEEFQAITGNESVRSAIERMVRQGSNDDDRRASAAFDESVAATEQAESLMDESDRWVRLFGDLLHSGEDAIRIGSAKIDGLDLVARQADLDGRRKILARLDKVESSLASRIDLALFSDLRIEELAWLKGSSGKKGKSEQAWNTESKKLGREFKSYIRTRGRGRRGTTYRPELVAKELAEQGVVPRWGKVAIERGLLSVTKKLNLSGRDAKAANGFLLRVYDEGASYFGEFPGIRRGNGRLPSNDEEEVTSTVVSKMIDLLKSGEFALSEDGYVAAKRQAVADAKSWWTSKVLCPRNHENTRRSWDSSGVDNTTDLTRFADPKAVDPSVDQSGDP
jgi:hypothetical protein